MLRRLSPFAAAGVLALAAGACASETSANDTDGPASVDLVAAFYPLEFVANRVGGDHASVTNLAPPGAEAHDLELTPSQVADLDQADLVAFVHGFQPAVDDAVEQYAGDASFDVTELVPLLTAGEAEEEHEEDEADDGHGHEETGTDLHVWLDPDRLATIAGELAAALGERDPDHAAEYRTNADALGEELATLDTEYAEGLAECERREIVVSHAAFGYLTDRYDLEQIAITGLSPEDEPSPQQMEHVIEEAREHGATTIFFEVLVSPAVAERIADQVGAETAVLDPIEGLAPDGDGDYFSIMRNNLAALRTALGCT
jgi:zinc transport system substrate-binding protein